MDPDVRANRATDEGEKESERERRFLFRDRLSLVRDSNGFVHADFCHCPLLGLVRAGPRATRRQSPLSASGRICGRTGGEKGYSDRRATVRSLNVRVIPEVPLCQKSEIPISKSQAKFQSAKSKSNQRAFAAELLQKLE